jgi:hypothetical protein
VPPPPPNVKHLNISVSICRENHPSNGTHYELMTTDLHKCREEAERQLKVNKLNYNFNLGCRASATKEAWGPMNYDTTFPPSCTPVALCRVNHPVDLHSEAVDIANDIPRCRREAEYRYFVEDGMNWNFNIGCEVLGTVIAWGRMNDDVTATCK